MSPGATESGGEAAGGAVVVPVWEGLAGDRAPSGAELLLQGSGPLSPGHSGVT